MRCSMMRFELKSTEWPDHGETQASPSERLLPWGSSADWPTRSVAGWRFGPGRCWSWRSAATGVPGGSSRASRGTAKSVVFIFQSGGPSQHETFDPKPHAPDEIRGEYGSIQTRLPGELFCEHLPKLAARSGMFLIVRTMHHVAGPEIRNEHNSCHYLLHTGTTELPIGDTNASITEPRSGRINWPSIGSMIAYASPAPPEVGLPAVVEIPRTRLMTYPGRESGLLGPEYDRLGADLRPGVPCQGCPPARAQTALATTIRILIPNVLLALDLTPGGTIPVVAIQTSTCRTSARRQAFRIPQLENRAALLSRLDDLRRGFDRHPHLAAWDAHRQQAMRFVLASHPGRDNPFDLTQESDRTRDLYRHKDGDRDSSWHGD